MTTSEQLLSYKLPACA